jgi:hypothetical protein
MNHLSTTRISPMSSTPMERRRGRVPFAAVAYLLLGLSAGAAAQPKAPVVATGGRPTVQQPQSALSAYIKSLTVSVNGSAPATQAIGPANPRYQNSAPNASTSVGATLNWTALPAEPSAPATGTHLRGYVVLRASATRPGGWDSVAFVGAPPAQVQAPISPEVNAIFRVVAHYTSLTFAVSPNPNGGSGVVTGSSGTTQVWNADTTSAVRVITP